jgi:chemotaxis protein CheD
MEQKCKEKQYFVEPGSIFTCWQPYHLATVLGSCVSVCLCDPITKIAGMSHFISPKKNDCKNPAYYGNSAIEYLLRMMCDMGAKPRNIQAHIVGGAYSPEHSSLKIGKKNVDIAKKMLNKYKIPIVNEDTGGTFGRKVMFNTMNGEIIVYKSKKIRDKDWYADKSFNN